MTPPRTTETTQPPVAAFPVFRVVIAPDGTSATLNGQPVPTTDQADLLAAVHAAADAAAADFGRPVRMDLVTPTGQVRRLTAHPASQAAANVSPARVIQSASTIKPLPVDAPTEPAPAVPAEPVPAVLVEPFPAGTVLADLVLAERLSAADQLPPPSPEPDSQCGPVTVPAPLLPRGDAAPTSETTLITPPAPPVNGTSPHRRLTPLDDPLPVRVDLRIAPEPRPAGEPPVVDRPNTAPDVAPPVSPATEVREFRRRRVPRSPRDQVLPAVTQAASTAADPAGEAPATLTPAGLLPRLRPTTARPTVGWPARAHTWTRGRWSPPPSQAEVRHRALVNAVQAGLTGPRLIAVVNPKGGAGKTPAVLAIAATWGAHRGSVVAWDNNETRGTLAMRSLADPRNPTVAGLLADLDRFDGPSARVGDLAAHLRSQGGARFDVLASDDDPTRMAEFGAVEFARVRDVLARFYAITVVDTGNNVRAGNWQAAVDAADQLLIVSTYQRDAAVTASWTLDHLHATGRGHLADSAVTVLSAATPATDRRTRTELRDHFQARTRTVVEIPYDPVIADGEHLDLHALRPATREAWLQATVALIEGLSR